MRNSIEVWAVRAQALLLAGQTGPAKAWAEKAARAADSYCFPDTKYPRLTKALLARTSASAASK